MVVNDARCKDGRIIKSCLWCGNPCSYYFNTIAPECAKTLGQEAEQLRCYIADNCPDYIRRPQEFFFYSDPAHTPYTEEDYNRDVII